jgi:sulfur-oxidizing protein SoxY
MDQKRRKMLKASSSFTALYLAVTAGLIESREVLAASSGYPDNAFTAKSMGILMNTLGSTMPIESTDVFVIAPDIAENGSSVSVGVKSTLKNVTEIAFLVTNNPFILSAQFIIPAGTSPQVSTRLKMNKSSDVYALVKSDGKYYFAKKEVKVTLGGCGA